MISNCTEGSDTKDHYLEEMKYNMNYAKWFRPILGGTLTIILVIVLRILDEFGLIKTFK